MKHVERVTVVAPLGLFDLVDQKHRRHGPSFDEGPRHKAWARRMSRALLKFEERALLFKSYAASAI
jgi:hypothetical protein